MDIAVDVGGAHLQRIDQRLPRRREACMQLVRRELVHQEPDGAAMHAVDRLAQTQVAVQGLEHEAVTAQRHDDVGLAGRRVAVACLQRSQLRLYLGRAAGKKGDAGGHGHRGLHEGCRE